MVVAIERTKLLIFDSQHMSELSQQVIPFSSDDRRSQSRDDSWSYRTCKSAVVFRDTRGIMLDVGGSYNWRDSSRTETVSEAHSSKVGALVNKLKTKVRDFFRKPIK